MSNETKVSKPAKKKPKGIRNYFLLGFVKGMSIENNKANEIMIEAAPSFIIEDGETKRILFASNDRNEKLDGTVAVLCELNNQKSYSCKVDASVLLQLKLNHVKVRFEFDSNLKTIRKVTVI